jgi:signal transduction histidine kinase
VKLRKKLVLIFCASYILIFTSFFIASNAFFMKGFIDIEDSNIRRQTELGLKSLELRIDELDQTTHGFAARDDTYYYVDSGLRHFINELLLSSTFIDYEISFMAFLNGDGDIITSKAFDLVELKNIPFPGSIREAIEQHSILKNHDETDEAVSGILMTRDGPIILSSRPILPTDRSGPIIGTLICGRYLDLLEVEKLKGSTFLSMEIMDFDDVNLTGPHASGSLALNGSQITIERQGYDTIIGYSALYDVFEEPALVLKVDSPRDVYTHGLLVLIYFIGSGVLAGVVIALLSISVMNRFILTRIVKLSEEVSEIDPHMIATTSVSIPGDDEVAMLSENIDAMLDALNLYQHRLKERERMATIGETSAMVGHDLRNPLQVVYLLGSRLGKKIGALRDSGVEESDIEDLVYIEDKLKEQTNYMNKIVSDLQDFSKNINVVYEDTDLEQVVVDVIGTLNVPENVDVSVTLDEGLRRVGVDGNLFRRVFTNLLTNGIQAMPEGGSLTVTGTSTDEMATIVVSDTGVGVSEENAGKLFQPLFTTKAKGTGLGLAVCKRIVEAHRGEISFESEEGVGTSFTIKIPMRGEEEGESLAEPQVPQEAEPPEQEQQAESRQTS